MIRDRELAMLYARALVAIARADAEIGLEEGSRLQQRIADRCETPLRIDDLLLEATLLPDHLAEYVGGGPFRGAAHPAQLAEWLVSDGLSVILAKGHVTQGEANVLWRFADALGVSREDFRKLTRSASRWFPWT
ncbi:MAG TPA: TerB family tellurite resistance protein [Kofleriaceae bacterium]|nr:TerB family tellurite resistance protein [Kofleriaceae bacterium]